ncbi:MAG: helicase C-terminal domain-containing protein [Candidatus Omnitrophota bacterium]
MFSINDFFKKDGIIAEHFDQYEERPQQIKMAEAVNAAIDGEYNLIAEAGTGVGKSLAYLVPFILWAKTQNKRIVISTYTKTLQTQLFVRDLPFLNRIMDFSYALCMGSENYVCLKKSDKNGKVKKTFKSRKKQKQFDDITEWLNLTKTGLLTDMEFVPAKDVWNKFSRDIEMCLMHKCSYKERCFFVKARKKQFKSQILVTNHALLFTDLTSEARVLPDFHGLVLDEAHMLEEVATGYFSSVVSQRGMKDLVNNIADFFSEEKIQKMVLFYDPETRDAIKRDLEDLSEKNEAFFQRTEGLFGKDEGVKWVNHDEIFYEELRDTLLDIGSGLGNLNIFSDENDTAREFWMCGKRCAKYAKILDLIFEKEKQGYIRWLDIKSRKFDTNYSFHTAPVDISENLRTCLFDRVSPVILTSATLSSSEAGNKQGFGFIKKRLGLKDCEEIYLGSPFDYKNNTLIYIPKTSSMDPVKDAVEYRKHITDKIIEIYDIMQGRMFALFTSFYMLNKAADEIRYAREDINILKQGDFPRYVLLDIFKKRKDSILMGTMTFWQGVDVAGEALECVVITKLPFSVPTDPINSSRMDFIRGHGGNPFQEYQLPQAIIMFKQGIGRLIRSRTDKGIIAILDPRIYNRSYGKSFIKALPASNQTNNLDDIRNFTDAFCNSR